MPSIPSLQTALQTVLTEQAESLARSSRVIRRQRKLSGALLLQTLIFGWLAHPAATLTQLTQMAARRGVQLSPQALDHRFTPSLVTCLEHLLAATLSTLVAVAEPVALPLLQRFSGVWLLDSTTLSLPADWAEHWPGCGGRPGEGVAAVKLQMRWDLLRGRLEGPEPLDGRAHDRRGFWSHAPLPAGSLRVSDLGFFSLESFRTLAAQGSFWLSRLQVNVVIQTLEPERVTQVSRWLRRQRDADGQVDVPVLLGVHDPVPARLLAIPVPPAVAAKRRRNLRRDAKKQGQMVSRERLARAGWTILVTNVPADRLSLVEARSLYRARWQIELVFKLWKQHGQLGHSRSANPQRIMAEIWAKLIGLVIQHWLMLTSGWTFPDHSLVKAAVAIRDQVIVLASVFDQPRATGRALRQVQDVLLAATRLNRRRTHPNTVQYLLDASLEP